MFTATCLQTYPSISALPRHTPSASLLKRPETSGHVTSLAMRVGIRCWPWPEKIVAAWVLTSCIRPMFAVTKDCWSPFIGAIKSNLLSTVITLAIYFCLADIIIISQTFYYKYVNARKIAVKEARRQSRSSNGDDPTQPLFSRRRSSGANSRNRPSGTIPSNLALYTIAEKNTSTMQEITRNFFSIISVIFIGCLGWFLAWKSGAWLVTVEDGDSIEMSLIGTILGYISSVLYLGLASIVLII